MDHINSYLAAMNIEVFSQHSQSKAKEVMFKSFDDVSVTLQPDLTLSKFLEFMAFKGFI